MTDKKGEVLHGGLREKIKKKPYSRPRKIRRGLRVVAYNVLFTFIGLGLIALAGEVYLRLMRPAPLPPFSSVFPLHYVQDVGLLLKPNVEVSHTNTIDFFTISHANSLGFLDREPIGPERASASCHIAMIGDSYVEARELPIADKFHVRLEELAAQHLPHLDITTSAFGRSATGQINQLPYYDEFARHLSPKLVVLVFVANDFFDNTPIRNALTWNVYPDRLPFVTVETDEDGTMKLRPPCPDWQMFRMPQLPKFHYTRILEFPNSYFVRALQKKNILMTFHTAQRLAWVELLRQHPDYESWFVADDEDGRYLGFGKNPLPFFEKNLSFTAFALDQFVERTERDGVSLVILATHTLGSRGHPRFDLLNALAEARGIPVIDQYDYLHRQGGEIPEARWANDLHWNEQGHQWAAEALLEYLDENPDVCTRGVVH